MIKTNIDTKKNENSEISQIENFVNKMASSDLDFKNLADRIKDLYKNFYKTSNLKKSSLHMYSKLNDKIVLDVINGVEDKNLKKLLKTPIPFKKVIAMQKQVKILNKDFCKTDYFLIDDLDVVNPAKDFGKLKFIQLSGDDFGKEFPSECIKAKYEKFENETCIALSCGEYSTPIFKSYPTKNLFRRSKVVTLFSQKYFNPEKMDFVPVCFLSDLLNEDLLKEEILHSETHYELQIYEQFNSCVKNGFENIFENKEENLSLSLENNLDSEISK